MARLFLLTMCMWIGSCGDSTPVEPVFPSTWETDLTEVRDCRRSIEHDLEFVRLLVDPGSVEHYAECVVPDSQCTEPFPEGALLVKPQYRDAECTDLVRISAVLREAAAPEPGPTGWRWQEVSAEGDVGLDGEPVTCVRCHTECEGSYDLRCVIDP